MKKRNRINVNIFILILICCCCLISGVRAQDIIVFRNGDEVKAKLLEITPVELKYKMFNSQDGPLFVVLKKDVFMVKYGNGNKEVFTEAVEEKADSSQKSTETISTINMYYLGATDARRRYKAYDLGWGVGVATAVCLPIGLATAIATSNTPPKVPNRLMDIRYANNKDYQKGFNEAAYKKKKKRAWVSFLVGACAAPLVLEVIIGASGVFY